MNAINDKSMVVCLLVLCAILVPAAYSFVLPLPTKGGSSVGRTIAFNTRMKMQIALDQWDDSNDDDDSDDEIDLDNRMKMGSSVGSNQEDPDDDISTILKSVGNTGNVPQKNASSLIAEWKEQLKQSPPPPLTTMRRVRIEKEIALLQELAHSDDAANELAHLWTTERGPDAAKVLVVADSLIQRGDPVLANKAEALLIRMVQEEGLQFVAPLLLLAWRYVTQGKVEESKDIYELVLLQKPWHMGAIIGAHNTCKHLKDLGDLAKWEKEILPSVNAATERQQWVRRMVAKAQKALMNAEHGLQSYFDARCDGEDLEGCIVFEQDFSEDAWQ